MPKLSKLPCYKTHPLTSRLVSPRCPASLPWWHRSVRLNGTPAKLPKSVCASQRSRKSFRCKRRLSVASDEVGIWWPSFFFSHFALSLFSMTFCNEKTCEGMIHYDIPKICRGTISRLWNGQWKTGKWVKRTSTEIKQCNNFAFGSKITWFTSTTAMRQIPGLTGTCWSERRQTGRATGLVVWYKGFDYTTSTQLYGDYMS